MALLLAAWSCGVAHAQGLSSDSQDVPSLRLRALVQTGSLKSAFLQYPPNYADFVVDNLALQRLGKALFWDQQVGSDGQACASCHFHAGADNRSKNQLNPGFRNQSIAFPSGDTAFGNSPLSPQSLPRFGPNHQLTRDEFPLHRLADPSDQHSALISDTNDVVASQGAVAARFTGLGLPGDQGRSDLGGPFDVGGALVRSSPPRNAPSVVNAAFNRRNFWDARARDEFNGADPIGKLDPTAQVVSIAGGTPQLVAISLPRSSGASQAVGPALSDLEMSYGGRRFAELGRKMLGTQPLAQQVVATDDSLLGPYSAQRKLGPGVHGITLQYVDLIAQAFAPRWWYAPDWRVDLSGVQPVLVQTPDWGPNLFTVLEYNFPLFFGLAIAEYERTLRADDTPFDRFLEGDLDALQPIARAGLEWFLGIGRCIRCHSGPELTNAGVSNVDAAKARTADVLDPANVERMIMGDGGIAVYDAGQYNIGVRPTDEDIGVGGRIGPGNLPLSDTGFFQECVRREVDRLLVSQPGVTADSAARQANVTCNVPHIRARPLEAAGLLSKAVNLAEGTPDQLAQVRALVTEGTALVTPPPFEIGPSIPPSNFKLGTDLLAQARDLLAASALATPQIQQLIAGATVLLPDPVDPGPDPANPFGPPLGPEERIAVNGAVKAPGLRNVELTAPYFHNGGQATLDQVVEFYDRGGDFHDANVHDKDADVAPIGLDVRQRGELVAFLLALTDQRVKYERAPFDHPSLSVPNGGTEGHAPLLATGVPVLDDRIELPAVGAAGNPVPLGTPGTPLANFPDPLWSQMVAAWGEGQRAAPGAALSTPLTVRVVDASGNPVPGVLVSFSAPDGAAVAPASAVTGPDGTAGTSATLSDTEGPQAFTASAFGVQGSPRSLVVEAASGAQGAARQQGALVGAGTSAAGGGCSSGTAGWPALLVVAWNFVRGRRRKLRSRKPLENRGGRNRHGDDEPLA